MNIKQKVVICPPCGESQGQRPQSRKVVMRELGKGVVNQGTFMDNPPSALRATSPTGGEANGGFTLIELLVVVLIIGILAAVALPQYQKAVNKSRMAEAKILMKALSDVQDLYALSHDECGTYNANDLDIDFGQISEDGRHIYTNYWDIYINDVDRVEGRSGNCANYELYEKGAYEDRLGPIAFYNGNAYSDEIRNVLYNTGDDAEKYGGYKPEGKDYWVF